MTKKFRNKIRKSHKALTFDDVLLFPGWSEVEPKQVNTNTHITPDITMRTPLVSSPMDTVTESEMAIALARQGGIGVLHRNCSIEKEVRMAEKVKRAESTIIRDVVTVTPEKTVEDARSIMEQQDIHGLPVTKDGSTLRGIVTWRDLRFAPNTMKVHEVMTEDVITASEDITIEEAKQLLHSHRIEKLPIVDDDNQLQGLLTVKDLMLKGEFPQASRDAEGKLICAAAVSPFEHKRAQKLDEYADILVTDVAHFHNQNVFKATQQLLSEVNAEVIVGNLGTYEAALDVLTKLDRIAGLRVGVGSGSICSTSEVTKAGVPTLYATAAARDAVEEVGADVSIIADGGIRHPGDIAVALGVGATAAMMGNIFAGCEESPGRLFSLHGRYYKEYYGMASQRAIQKRRELDRYGEPSKEITEGVEGWVPFRGTVADVVSEFTAGLKASMGYIGAKSIPEVSEKARIVRLSQMGQEEMAPSNIIQPGKEEDNQ